MASGKLVLFDVDGVIIDSFSLLYKNLSALLKEKLDKDLTVDQYRAFFRGNPLQEILKYVGLSSLLHLHREDLARVFAGYDTCAVFAGMHEVIAAVAKNNKVGIVTSSAVEVVKPKFVTELLDQYILVYLGEEIDRHKDKKIRLAMSEFGFTPADTWFITDTSGDLEEAHKTGITTIAATWGFHPREWLAEQRPAHIVESPQRLSQILLT